VVERPRVAHEARLRLPTRSPARPEATPNPPLDPVALRRDQVRFSDLVSRHHEQLARLAYVLCGHRELAEDAVADAYAKAWPQFRRGRIEEPYPYLRRAVVNQVRGGFRRRVLAQREERRHTVDWRDSETPVQAVDDRSVLAAALRELPFDQRVVLALRFLEDLSEQETALALGLKPGTVKSRTARGLEHLGRLVERKAATR
jgi:RNA polymerase sigma factor (sigma-70 family)